MGRISIGLVSLAIGLGWLASAADVDAAGPQLAGALSSDFLSTNLKWTGEPGPTGYFLIERSITGSESAPRTYETIGDLKAFGLGPFAFVDSGPRAGWNCYRVRAKADNFEYSNEVCVEIARQGNGLPVPAKVTFERETPIPPDWIGVPRIVAWEWPANPAGLEAVIEASVPPRFSAEQPPYIAYARIPATQAPRVSVNTVEWRGPYCFRVRFVSGIETGAASAPVCVPRTADTAPYDIVDLSVVARPLSRTARISWEYRFLPTTVTIQRSSRAGAAETEWKTIAQGVPARVDSNFGEFIDPHTEFGTVCYRVKPDWEGVGEFGEDTLRSPEACISWPRPVVDGPRAPDVGNSPAVAMPGFHYQRELTVVGVLLLVVGLVNWWIFRGYR